MRDNDNRDADFDGDLADVALQCAAGYVIERRKWFIKQQDFRPHCQRAGERNALLLAARQVLHVPRGITLELHELKQFVDAGLDLSARPARKFQT